MNVRRQIFGAICFDIVRKLSVEHVVLSDLTLVCVEEECK
jgi:hypothetical protein